MICPAGSRITPNDHHPTRTVVNTTTAAATPKHYTTGSKLTSSKYTTFTSDAELHCILILKIKVYGTSAGATHVAVARAYSVVSPVWVTTSMASISHRTAHAPRTSSVFAHAANV